MHEVLVNRLGGLSLSRKSVVRSTDRPDMTNNNNCIYYEAFQRLQHKIGPCRTFVLKCIIKIQIKSDTPYVGIGFIWIAGRSRSIQYYPITLQCRWGTTDDFATILFPFFPVFSFPTCASTVHPYLFLTFFYSHAFLFFFFLLVCPVELSLLTLLSTREPFS